MEFPFYTNAGLFDSNDFYPGVTYTNTRCVENYEIEFFDKGGGLLKINGTDIPVKAGLVVIAKPESRRSSRLPFTCWYTHLLGVGKEIKETLDALDDYIYTDSNADFIAQIKIMSRLVQRGGDLLERSLEAGKLVHMLAGLKRGALWPPILKEAVRYMSLNFPENPALEDVAAAVGYSPVYFHSLFKKYAGITPCEYMLRLRVGYARELLMSERISLSDISDRCGFCNQSYFNRIFKRFEGVLPSTYRKQNSGYRL